MMKLLPLVLLFVPMFTVNAQRFNITYPASASKEALDGRLLLLISTNKDEEPRFQISEDLTTQQVFGVDVDAWKPGETKTVDQNAFGYPVRSLSELKPGEYWVQALLHRYETFKRSDGHTVKLPMDRGEGQQWNSAPGNLYSTPETDPYRRRRAISFHHARPGNSADRAAERHEVHQAHPNSE